MDKNINESFSYNKPYNNHRRRRLLLRTLSSVPEQHPLHLIPKILTVSENGTVAGLEKITVRSGVLTSLHTPVLHLSATDFKPQSWVAACKHTPSGGNKTKPIGNPNVDKFWSTITTVLNQTPGSRDFCKPIMFSAIFPRQTLTVPGFPEAWGKRTASFHCICCSGIKSLGITSRDFATSNVFSGRREPLGKSHFHHKKALKLIEDKTTQWSAAFLTPAAVIYFWATGPHLTREMGGLSRVKNKRYIPMPMRSYQVFLC